MKTGLDLVVFIVGGLTAAAAAFRIDNDLGWVVVGLLLMVVALEDFPE